MISKVQDAVGNFANRRTNANADSRLLPAKTANRNLAISFGYYLCLGNVTHYLGDSRAQPQDLPPSSSTLSTRRKEGKGKVWKDMTRPYCLETMQMACVRYCYSRPETGIIATKAYQRIRSSLCVILLARVRPQLPGRRNHLVDLLGNR